MVSFGFLGIKEVCVSVFGCGRGGFISFGIVSVALRRSGGIGWFLWILRGFIFIFRFVLSIIIIFAVFFILFILCIGGFFLRRNGG